MNRSQSRFYGWVMSLFVIALALVITGILSQSARATFTSCENETTFTVGAEPLEWSVTKSLRTIKVRGGVTGTFTGTCRGLATVHVTVKRKRVHQRHYHRVGQSINFRNLEFGNGYRDSGKPFEFSFRRTLKPQFHEGDCLKVNMTTSWRYQENSVVTPSQTVTARQRHC